MSKIEWTGETWNPIAGCTILSPGCTHCYAMSMAARIERMTPSLEHYKGLTRKVNGKAVWTGKVALAPEKTLLEPLRRKKPTTYFVNSMSDLFHESVPDEWVTQIFVVMMVAHHHTYQVLTKRPKRMLEWMTAPNRAGEMAAAIHVNGLRHGWGGAAFERKTGLRAQWPWPPENVWLGVSCERQKEADERIPALLATPAAVRFVSAEPLLGPIDLWRVDEEDCALRGVGVVRSGGVTPSTPHGPPEGYDDSYPGLDWVIVGGESGRDARPMHPDWARSIRDQCTAAGVAFFFKQWGAWGATASLGMAKPGTPTHVFRTGETVETFGGPVPLGVEMQRVGKKAAGRLLDGREWNEMPTIDGAKEP